MVRITKERLIEIMRDFGGIRICVIGDLMLDRYLWGAAARISPEAPVPVVEIDSEATRLGGAANVVHNLYTLGAEAMPFGVIGNDFFGEMIVSHFRDLGFDVDGIIRDSSRTTALKTRIIAHSQHVVRADQETRTMIEKETADGIVAALRQHIGECDAVIFQDYNKGLLTPYLIGRCTKLANGNGVIVAVDPKFDHFFEYRDVTLFKPNRKETEGALGRSLRTEDDIANGAREIRERLSCDNVLVTLGEDGMCLLESSGECSIIPTKARKVHDVSGAGDTVISTLTLALAAGATMKEATMLANYAAGVVCGEVGVVPINKEKLLAVVAGD